MPKLKSGTIIPSPEENAAINAGIAADPDTYELDDTEFAQLGRAGRFHAAVTKERINIRLSPDVVAAFRASGEGWQARIDSVLRDWLKSHSPV